LSYTREAGVSLASGPAHAWRSAWRRSYKASPRTVKAAWSVSGDRLIVAPRSIDEWRQSNIPQKTVSQVRNNSAPVRVE